MSYRPLNWHPKNPFTEAVPTSVRLSHYSIVPWERVHKSWFPTIEDYIKTLAGKAADTLGLKDWRDLPYQHTTHENGDQTIAFAVDRGRRAIKGQEHQAEAWENGLGVLLRL